MEATNHCPTCGRPLSGGVPWGLCPRCLLAAARGGMRSNAPSPPGPEAAFSDPEAPPTHLRYFGDYELEGRVGAGGMGVVFRARQRSLDRGVAVKLIRSGHLATVAERARFRQEAQTAAALQHPGIVAIYEVGEQEGQLYYSMEFVAGRNLAQELQGRPLEPRAAAALLREIAETIQFAHERGVLHRDLKPANILLDERGRPRVSDFGLARRGDRPSDLTASGAVVGSPNYMPPEQARGLRAEIDARSDVYALGAMLYECLTGRPPFAAASFADTLRLVVEREAIPPRRLNPHLPRDLEVITLKCLAKERAGRYPSALELAADLGRFLRHEPIRARRTGRFTRVAKWARRRPAVAGLTAVLGLAAAGWAIEALSGRSRLLEQRRAVDLFQAAQAVERGDLRSARSLLARYGPGFAEPDGRGFAWHYLWQRCAGDQRRTLAGHPAALATLAFSPSGKRLVTADDSGEVRLWDPTNGTAVAVAHLGTPISWLAFADEATVLMPGGGRAGPSETVLAGGSVRLRTVPGAALAPLAEGRLAVVDDAGLRILDGATGSPLASATNGAVMLAGARNGQRFTTADAGGRVCLWAADPLTQIAEAAVGRSLAHLALSPNGRMVATVARNSRRAVLWRTVASDTRLAAVAELAEHAAPITALAFAPDGRVLLTAASDGTLRLWNAFAGAQAPTAVAPLQPVQALEAVTELHQRRAPRLGDAIGLLRGHLAPPLAVAFSPDGARLASGDIEGTVHLWNVRSTPLNHFPGVALPLVISPDSRWIAARDLRGRVLLRTRAELGESTGFDESHEAPVLFSGDGRELGLARPAEEGGGWQIDWFGVSAPQTRLRHVRLEQSAALMRPLRWLASGRVVAAISDAGTAALWDLMTGRARLHWTHLARDLATGALSPDGRRIALVSATGQVEVWDPVRRQRDPGPNAPGLDQPRALAFSPDGRSLAAGGDRRTVSLWNLRNGSCVDLSGRHIEPVTALSFAPDERTLASGDGAGAIRLWDLATHRELMALDAHDAVTAVEFTPDGRTLLATTRAGLLWYWHTAAVGSDAPAGLGDLP